MTAPVETSPAADERAPTTSTSRTTSTAADGRWPTGPRWPALADGAVHVWRVDLATAGSAGLEELLSTAERERAARMLSERDGQLWARARGLLRALLGRYLRADPASLRLAIGAQGKPALAGPVPTQLPFNLSHSGQTALYAFTEHGAVGVDVEVDRRTIDEPAIAARVLGAAEARRLQSLDPPARRREFLRVWTRHEAAQKCHGAGIGAGSSSAHSLWIAELELGTHAAGAVAVDGPVRELCCWDWR